MKKKAGGSRRPLLLLSTTTSNGYFRFFAAFRAVFFRPPLRADFFLAPFFRVAMGSSPLKEFGCRPIPRWTGGDVGKRHGRPPHA